MGAVSAGVPAMAADMAGFAMRSAMAAIFVIAALHALRDRAEYARIVQAYRILPAALGHIFALLLPPMEAVVAIALVLPGARRAGTMVALAMLVCFTAAIAINLVRGRRDIACGCGGGTGQTISWPLAVRNVILSGGLAASLAAPATLRLGPAALVGIAGLASFLAVLYLAANQLMVNAVAFPRATARARA